MNEKRERFRTLVKWTGIVFIAHIVAMIFFGLFLSSSCARYEENDTIGMANSCAFVFSILMEIFLVAVYHKIQSSDVGLRKSLREAMKEESFSVISYYRKNKLIEDLWRVAVVAAFQLPFAIFYAVVGISYLYSTLFEEFYIIDAGYYVRTGSPILGLMLGTIIFGVIFMLLRLLFLKLTVRNIEEL